MEASRPGMFQQRVASPIVSLAAALTGPQWDGAGLSALQGSCDLRHLAEQFQG